MHPQQTATLLKPLLSGLAGSLAFLATLGIRTALDTPRPLAMQDSEITNKEKYQISFAPRHGDFHTGQPMCRPTRKLCPTTDRAKASQW